MNRKIAAFTLLELTISMVLMSLLVAIGYLGYELIQKQSLQWQKHTKERATHLFFLSTLSEDILEAESCHYELSTQKFLCKKKKHQVSYFFNETYVVRNQEYRKDTIEVVVKKVSPHFLAGNNTDETIIDFLGLEIAYLDTNMYVPIRKWYAIQTLLEYGY